MSFNEITSCSVPFLPHKPISHQIAIISHLSEESPHCIRLGIQVVFSSPSISQHFMNYSTLNHATTSAPFTSSQIPRHFVSSKIHILYLLTLRPPPISPPTFLLSHHPAAGEKKKISRNRPPTPAEHENQPTTPSNSGTKNSCI